MTYTRPPASGVARRRLKVLARLSRMFSEAIPDCGVLLETVAREIAEVTGDGCTVRLLDEDGQKFRPVAAHHPDPSIAAEVRTLMAATVERADIGLWRPVIDEQRNVRIVMAPDWLPPGASPQQIEFFRRHPVRSIIGAPLIARGRTIGGLSLVRFASAMAGEAVAAARIVEGLAAGSVAKSAADTSPVRAARVDAPHGPGDELLVRDLADRAALAIDNARLLATERAAHEREREARLALAASEAASRRHAEQLELVNGFARTVSGTLDLDSVCHLIVNQTASLLGGAGCVIFRHDSAAMSFQAIAVTPGDRTKVGDTVAQDGTLLQMALRSRQPQVVQAPQDAPAPDQARMAASGAGSIAMVPIVIDGDVWGMLAVGFSATGAATDERVAFLNNISVHLAVALKNAGLYTSLERARDDAIQRERLRALGEMAAGVVHDLNNALTPVLGYSELLLAEPALRDAPARLRQLIELIRTGASDAAAAVNRLREFYRARDDREVTRPVALDRVASQVIELTQPKWKDQAQAAGRTITIANELIAVPSISGSEAALREALTNLLFNAVDALTEGGTITLRTRAEAGQVILEVVDDGTGMTEDVRRRCLEPFFSTKKEQGTGLGLAMVYGIVRRHSGIIEIDTAPGQGCTFRLRFPARADIATVGPVETSSHVIPALRVLVVDDDPGARAVTLAFLAADGHTTIDAANGRDALQLFGDGAEFDLVITDGAMPGMSGEQLALAIKSRAPTVKVLLLSGFGDLMGGKSSGIDAVLGKPATLAGLRRTVSELACR